jgi:diguanylate cyclase (GGDEF)-like protein/PAS domain S-box-containing protein
VKRRDLVTGSAAAAAVFTLAALLHWNGYFDRVENALAEYRDSILERTVNSDIVIVGIDAHSLEELSEWPWPRSLHARLLQHLDSANPAQVFLDIDFSSTSPDAGDDERLEQQLAAWSGAPVLLAAHNQASLGGSGELLARRPLERFRRHALEVSIAIAPDRDGIVRTLATSDRIGDSVVPSAFAAGRVHDPDSRIDIDFSIDPESFAYVSYSDLLNLEVDLAALQGKRIYVGAISPELGDAVPVPRHRSLPGIVVQALAATTLETGAPYPLPDWLLAALLVAWTALWSLAFARGSWRQQALAGLGGLAALALVTIALDGLARIELGVMPFAFVLTAAFVVQSIRSLDYQTLRAIAYAVGVRRRDALIKSVIETSMDSIICLDRDGIIHTANPAASALFVAPLRSLIGAPIRNFIPNLENPEALAGSGGIACEFLARDSSKRQFPVEATISRVAVDDRELFTMFVRDVRERKEQQSKLEYQATHDPLTQLPNRAAVNSYLGSLLNGNSRVQRVALLMLDLCRFKEVNDTLGHDVGDEVLRIVSRRFSETLTDRAFIGRIGGDEFVVVVPEVAVRQAVEQLTESLVESLKTPIQVRGIAIEVGLSVGIAFYPEHAGDAGELLRHADIAMYSAKRRNSAWEFYCRDDDRHSIRRLSMVSDLRSAIGRSEIELLFQPQIELRSGRLAGAEALLRWEHPVHGSVSPVEFVAIAESTDLIQPLTEWTIVESLKQLVNWRHAGLETRVAVNLSARALQDVDFPRHLDRLLARFGVDGRRLELEITETAMMLDPQRALAIVRDVQALGVRIAIDDFGTGYSSLGYLRDLRASALKLDKSFVIDLENREQNRVIVESTAHMAEALGLEVVAEGIESQWVCDYLRDVGYTIGQGYWFGRPMTAAALIERYAVPAASAQAIAS